MNFRIYFPESYSFSDAYDYKLDLKLECFNSVDGWHRLVILFGWYRQVCSNGLVIGDTRTHIDERHGKALDLTPLCERFRSALTVVEADRIRMVKWQTEKVATADIAAWANTKLSEAWGKKAAARVYHICDAGRDIEFADPFADGEATEKAIRYLGPVPGCPERASTKYDVLQAMSFVATHRNNVEQRLSWQTAVATSPVSVNLMALPTRLFRTCVKRRQRSLTLAGQEQDGEANGGDRVSDGGKIEGVHLGQRRRYHREHAAP
jgi:Domain of unknown function (DUF932)